MKKNNALKNIFNYLLNIPYVAPVRWMWKNDRKFFFSFGAIVFLIFISIVSIYAIFNTLQSFPPRIPSLFGIFLLLIGVILGEFIVLIYASSVFFYYPFITYWLNCSPIFSFYFGKKNINSHLGTIQNIREEVDFSTSDDIYIKSERNFKGDISFSSYRGRQTANRIKNQSTFFYILFQLMKPIIYWIFMLITPLLAIIVMPLIKSDFCENGLDSFRIRKNRKIWPIIILSVILFFGISFVGDYSTKAITNYFSPKLSTVIEDSLKFNEDKEKYLISFRKQELGDPEDNSEEVTANIIFMKGGKLHIYNKDNYLGTPSKNSYEGEGTWSYNKTTKKLDLQIKDKHYSIKGRQEGSEMGNFKEIKITDKDGNFYAFDYEIPN